jgi:hypothetical protein
VKGLADDCRIEEAGSGDEFGTAGHGRRGQEERGCEPGCRATREARVENERRSKWRVRSRPGMQGPGSKAAPVVLSAARGLAGNLSVTRNAH